MRSFKLTDLRLLACLLKLSCWHKLGILPIIPELDVEPSDLQELFHDTHEGCSGWVAELTAQRQQIARLGRGGGVGVLTYTGAPQRRVLVVSERGGIPPLPRHTSHRPDAHAVSLRGEMSQPGGDCERGPRRRDNSGRLPSPDPRGLCAHLPSSDSFDETRTPRL